MSYLKTKGIVLKEINFGEADKIITIFSKDQGKISASAKGARRPKSNFVAGSQFLCYSDFVLFKGRDMYSLNSCDVIEPFYEIRNDVEKLTYSAHMADIVNDIVQENQPSSKVLKLFLNSIHFLTKTDKNPELITRIFEFRILSIIGYAPYVKGCMECGRQEFKSLFFSFEKCGFVCNECVGISKSPQEISVGAAKALYYIIYADIKDLFGFNLSDSVLNELGRISKRYLRDMLEKDYNKLDFLKGLR